MKKKRILFGAVAAVCCSALCLSACGGGGSQQADGDFTYWVELKASLATHVSSYNEVAMYQYLEEKTGVHIDFIHPASGQASSQFQLLLASGDYPDMVEYHWSNYQGGTQKAIEDGVIVPLNDYLDDAPNFKKTLTDKSNELSEIYRKNSITDNGDYYGFTALDTGNYRVFGGPLIRRDLLDKYGLEMPETIDDWTKVLRTFKENGIKIPLTGSTTETFVGAFGTYDDWYVDNGTMKYGPMEDGFKDYLALLNMWYSEGLLDKDFNTNKSALIDSKILNEESAASTHAYIGGTLSKYLGNGANWDMVGAPYPVMNKGDVNEFPNMETDVLEAKTLAITTACDDVVGAVKWADNFYSEEGYMLKNFGVEGVSYNMVDGKPVYTDIVLKNPEGLSIAEAIELNCRATQPAPGFSQAPEYLEQYYPYDQQKETLNLWEANTNPGRTHKVPALSSTLEETDFLGTIKADLQTFVEEQMWGFISGERSLDEFDNFRNEIKEKFQFDKYQKVMQDQYNRYLAR